MKLFNTQNKQKFNENYQKYKKKKINSQVLINLLNPVLKDYLSSISKN